ncbi:MULTISPECIES: hypothetical protein [unclassified Mesorhizobium]|uniref:hypothetical protein n=1 Tax=unclassified Mesorhizobium TaxID=325217 RepID=UPI000FDA8AFF|nr:MULTISPECIES: hypothetical protein [unclassified Mesorhizobium]TGQ39567.1 hypothetical protein EN859_016495 [Mesorhizobium sp. M00.F.Ca.ET.216.01.1.1]TIS57246.1 MAG: hypothetical protein E5W91_14010 [Mesorhizobium sp.]TIS91736.1 MAG: hypothetical protein E5W89_06085 [Mesorhizobium sp.]TJW11574.1 MAG: hypothetical protein E5W82_17630 [Mesorhizobium sp.]TJW46519.1 MAG: hypothetical protein E5W83_08620 [Mesorhizobium sp.]
MVIARKVLSMGLAGALATMLAACATSGPGEPPGAAAPTGVEGSWLNAEGNAVSTLNGGKFTTVSAETGEKFADGSYTKTGTTSVAINGTSLIRQQPISFNCLLVSTSQLNCTSATGQNFVLTRRV